MPGLATRSTKRNTRAVSDSNKIVIVSGPNGAGKTTFAREFLPREADCSDFVNVDLIAAGLSPFDPSRAAMRAGGLCFRKLRGGFSIERALHLKRP